MTLSVVATVASLRRIGGMLRFLEDEMGWKTITTESGRVCQCPTGQQADGCRAMLAWLEARVWVHPAAHGYVKGRSVVTALLPHAGARYLAHLDLVSFFPSTTEEMIVSGMIAAGLSRGESEGIAGICCYRGRLPVGACTSPFLSNVACIPLDEMASINHTYTRYSDQLIFSSLNPLDEGELRWFVRQAGHVVNERKSTLLVRGRTSVIVMGYQIGEKEITRPRAYRRAERARRHNEEMQSGS